MTGIREAQAAVRAAQEHLRRVVTEARDQGRTWAEVGEELGMTRQAAFKRFGKPVDPVSGEDIPKRSVDHAIEVTEQVVRLMSEGDYERVHALMHPRTRDELPTALLSQAWQKVLSEVGTLQACRSTHAELPDGTHIGSDEEVLGSVIIGQTTLECEAGEMLGRVALDDRLSVVGLLLVPMDHGPLPF